MELSFLLYRCISMLPTELLATCHHAEPDSSVDFQSCYMAVEGIFIVGLSLLLQFGMLSRFMSIEIYY